MLTKAIKRGKYGLDEQSLQIIKRLDFRRCYMGKGHMPTKLEWRRVPAVRHLGLREVKGLTPEGMTDATRGCKKLRSVDLRRTPVTPARHSFARAIPVHDVILIVLLSTLSMPYPSLRSCSPSWRSDARSSSPS